MDDLITLDGRRGRLSFLFATLGLIAAQIVLVLILTMIGVGPDATDFISAAIVLWPQICIGVQRFHDLGQSGWWMLLTAIPIVNLLVFLYLLFVPGMSGTNDYGASPA